MLMEDARERIVAFGKRIATEGLAVGTSGNLSEYDPTTGLMAISPSGLGYFETTPADIVVLRLDGTVVEGELRPSSEAPLHAEVYRRRPAARAVVHTHSPYATTLAALGEPIRAVHFTIADSGAEEVPLSPYVTFGTPELAASVGKTFGEHPATSAVLMENHGLVACGWACRQPRVRLAHPVAGGVRGNAARALWRGGHGRFKALRDLWPACRRQGIKAAVAGFFSLGY